MNNEYTEAKYSKSDVIKQMDLIEQEKSLAKKDYWISCGSALLAGNEELVKKWGAFVEEIVTSFGNGSLLDETLQIMSMIKMNMPSEKIKSVLSTIAGKGTVITYLSSFIHPELLNDLEESKQL